MGYLSQVSDLRFQFNAEILQVILVTLKPANLMLQASSIDLKDGVELIENCISSVQKMRNDSTFDRIWNSITQNDSESDFNLKATSGIKVVDSYISSSQFDTGL